MFFYDIELYLVHILLILNRHHGMRGLVKFIEVAKEIDFLSVGYPFPEDHDAGSREIEPVIFAAVVDALVEGVLLCEIITIIIDCVGGSLDTLDRMMLTSKSSGCCLAVAQD